MGIKKVEIFDPEYVKEDFMTLLEIISEKISPFSVKKLKYLFLLYGQTMEQIGFEKDKGIL